MKKFLLVLMTIFLTGSIVYGASRQIGDNYSKVLQKTDGSAAFIDNNSISKTGEFVTFDMVINYVNNKENIDYSEQTLIYNCERKEWKMLKLIDYMNNGITHRTPEGFLAKLPFQKINGAEDIEAYFKYVCK